MVDLSQKQELRNRVESKKRELQSKLEQAKADSRQSSRSDIEQIENKLDELNSMIEDGWDKLTEGVAGKLNDWLSS